MGISFKNVGSMKKILINKVENFVKSNFDINQTWNIDSAYTKLLNLEL